MKKLVKTFKCSLAAVILLCSDSSAQSIPQASSLTIKTIPEGAIVKIDGKREGISPVTVSSVKPGSHIITLEKNDYESVCTGVNIEEGQNLTKEIKLDPVLGLLILDSSPNGADLKINGVDRGRTPMLLTDLPLGKYQAKFSKPGYQDKNIEFILKSRAPMKVDTELTSDSGSLQISSEPPGAQAFINGILSGTTPCSVGRMPSGPAKIELKLDGYTPYSTEIKLIAGRSEVLTAALVPIPAKLSIFSIPEEARIYVDNQFRGKAPVSLNNLKPGEYRIRAELDGFDPTARTITLGNGDDKREELRLDGNCGSLQIVTQPAGVSIFVDGKAMGVTTVKDNQTDNVSNPFTIPLIRAGEHTIKLSSKKHHTLTFQTTIKEGETTLVQKVLQRKFIPDIEVKTYNDVITGVLMEEDVNGNLKIEVAPGVVKTVEARDIRQRNVLRSDNK